MSIEGNDDTMLEEIPDKRSKDLQSTDTSPSSSPIRLLDYHVNGLNTEHSDHNQIPASFQGVRLP